MTALQEPEIHADETHRLSLLSPSPPSPSRLPRSPSDNAPQPFTEAAFDAAQKAGKPILIDTYATWCDICARQKPIIDKLLGEPQYKERRHLAREFRHAEGRHAQVQCAAAEHADRLSRRRRRSAAPTGETQPEWIDDLMSKMTEKSSGS